MARRERLRVGLKARCRAGVCRGWSCEWWARQADINRTGNASVLVRYKLLCVNALLLRRSRELCIMYTPYLRAQERTRIAAPAVTLTRLCWHSAREEPYRPPFTTSGLSGRTPSVYTNAAS